MATTPDSCSVYCGCYQPQGREGLFHLRFDLATGRLGIQGALSGVPNPSFLALRPDGRALYAASEAPGGAGGEVCAFGRDPRSGDLAPLNRQGAHGRATCHVSLAAGGRYLLATNYAGPTIALYPVRADGGLQPAATVVRHEGSGAHARQAEPHPHSATPDPSGRFVYCPDLGIDRVQVYRLDATAGALLPADPPGVGTAPGAGPRHLEFHPRLPYAYLINELDSTVVAYAWEAATGALRALQVSGTLPADFRGESTGADIHVHPGGRFVYASNRGHDSIAVFGLAADSGRLTPLGHHGSGGRTPRNFALHPGGAWLLAANQGSDALASFGVDAATGRLEPTGHSLALPAPACVVFAQAGG